MDSVKKTRCDRVSLISSRLMHLANNARAGPPTALPVPLQGAGNPSGISHPPGA